MASYRPPVLMSSSMPDSRRVSLAPVRTLAPSGTRSLMRARASAASSRISAAKPPARSAAATRSSRSAVAGSVKDAAGCRGGRGVGRVGPGALRRVGRRARQRGGVEVPDLVQPLGELPALRGALVAVVVDGVVQALASVEGARELLEVGAAGRGVAVEQDRAGVCGLHEEVPLALQPLAPGTDLLAADLLDGDVGHAQGTVRCEQRRQAGSVAHHHRVGELAAQRLDLDAVRDGLEVVHRGPSRSCCRHHRYDNAALRNVRRSVGLTFPCAVLSYRVEAQKRARETAGP